MATIQRPFSGNICRKEDDMRFAASGHSGCRPRNPLVAR
jgi:hypothetical protein